MARVKSHDVQGVLLVLMEHETGGSCLSGRGCSRHRMHVERLTVYHGVNMVDSMYIVRTVYCLSYVCFSKWQEEDEDKERERDYPSYRPQIRSFFPDTAAKYLGSVPRRRAMERFSTCYVPQYTVDMYSP